MAGSEDPVEGEILVGLKKSSSNARGGRVIQGGPSQLAESRKLRPLQPIHPHLLTLKEEEEEDRCKSTETFLSHPDPRWPPKQPWQIQK